MATTTAFKRYRTKPLEHEAMRFEGSLHFCHGGWDGRYPDDWAELREFMRDNLRARQVGSEAHGGRNQFLPFIHTSEGMAVLHKGEWVLRDEEGNFSRRTAEAFSATFEEIPFPDGPCATCGGRRFITGFVATLINPRGDMPCSSCNM